MTAPIKQLREVLRSGKSSGTGRVVATTATTVSVALRSGVVQLARTDATAYNVGDIAIVRNNILQGKRQDEATLPVFVL